MQRRGFDPPLGRILSVEGTFPLELTWVLTPFPKKSFGWEYKPRSSLGTHAFHHTDYKDPDIHVLDAWMPAIQPSMHHPQRRNTNTSMLGLKKNKPSHILKISTRVVNPTDIAVERRRRRMVNPTDIAGERRRRRMVNPTDIAGERRRRRMVNPTDIAGENRRRQRIIKTHLPCVTKLMFWAGCTGCWEVWALLRLSSVAAEDLRDGTDVGVREGAGCWVGVGVREIGGGVGVGVGVVAFCRPACWPRMAAAICWAVDVKCCGHVRHRHMHWMTAKGENTLTCTHAQVYMNTHAQTHTHTLTHPHTHTHSRKNTTEC